ncbi:hypothetical protein Aca07nite_79000 [Actinoplanes capillaceus]|uniref:Serine phosphatase RsbU, regulator of sigma subunit n=1 Tax=Actinoplanes campanulatus TaxID=113559 RepID=A0ABQ3WWW3_9ACTN|nr:SpoIIE family protein phosphatase [Actinoplanes capillaceus]GID50625.1 hypothetical protein Aca07nite_79000 [Actinoplanes capillaceus]
MTVVAPASALLQAAFEAAGEGMLLCDNAGHTVLLANAAARRLVPGALPGEPVTGPFPEPGADSFRCEFEGRSLSGTRRDLDGEHYAWFIRDETEQTRHIARSEFLAEVGWRLSASLHVGRVMRTVVELAVQHLADTAMVVLPPHRHRSSWTRLLPERAVEEGTLPERLLDGVPGLVEALGGFPPIPSRWLDPARAPGWLLPAELGPVGAMLVTPLPGTAEPAGALILARHGATAVFGEEDEALARVFAARAGMAIAAATLYHEQSETADILKADLLPPDLPVIDGLELAGSHHLHIGGDFYDVFGPAGDSTDTVIALGDVCGTGPEAAVLTGKVRQTLGALRLVRAEPEAMLRVLNDVLLRSGRRSRFVTMVVGSVRRVEHGRVRLELATGGHPSPLVLRTDGTVEEVPVQGALIGVMPLTDIRPATVELGPGELCLLYSDGLTEARGGPAGREHFGEDRLHRALADCAGMPATAVVERLSQVVSDWLHGSQSDDIAMLAVRAPARTALSLRGGGVPEQSPFLIAARRGDRRSRARS